MKRVAATIKECDYTSKEEFERDIPRMKEKGYKLICDGMYHGMLHPSEIEGDDYWHYTASFVKSTMM